MGCPGASRPLERPATALRQATKLVQLALALVSQAQKTTDTNVRARLVDQFNALLPQIDQVTADANFNGINLLEGGDLRLITNQNCCPAVSVNLLALQTRQQLSNITQWLATQAEQNVLRLLWQAD